MKERMKVVLVAVMVLLAFSLAAPGEIPGLTPVTVQAASSAAKKKAQKAYRNWMYESDAPYFRVIDIDRDGLKELLVTYRATKRNGIYCADSCRIYTYSKGRVVFTGEEYYSMFGLTYNKKTGRVHGSRGGGGGIENWYYTLTKGNKLKKVYLQALEKGVVNGKMTYNYRFNGKKISKKTYTNKSKIWNKYSSDLRFYKTTMSNVKKRLVL